MNLSPGNHSHIPTDLLSLERFPEFVPSEAIISNNLVRITEILFALIINFIISFLGIFTNILVIIVFAKQGFKDSVAVSMTTIAVWDLIKSLAGALQRMRGPIALWSPAAAETWSNIGLVVFNYLISFSCYVTSVLAAYVAVERCLCVTMPLKVKWLLTPKTSCIICIAISVIVFGCFAVMFGIYNIFWVYDPQFNATIAVYRYNNFATNNTLLFSYYNLSGTVWPLVSLVVIVLSTVIISVKLRRAAEFRSRYTDSNTQPNSEQNDQNKSKASAPKATISKRDQQVMKMLLVIIAIYIFNLGPRVVHYLAKYLVPEYYFLRKYHNLAYLMSYVIFVFDFINGSVNLFIFLAMSSAFRATYFEIFPYCRRTTSEK